MTAAARARRRVDRWFYRLLFRAYRLARPTRAPAGPLAPSAARRILVHPNAAIGDLVVVTPALTYLRWAAPQARIDVLATPRNAALLARDPRVDRVVPVRGRGWPALRLACVLRRECYDVVLDCVFGHHAAEGWFCALAANRHAVRATFYRPPQYRGLFTHLGRAPGFARRHMAERVLYAAAAAVGGGAGARRPDVGRYPMRLVVDDAACAAVDAFLRAHRVGPYVAVNRWATADNRSLTVPQLAAALAEIAVAHPDLAFVLTPPPGADAAPTVAAVRALAPDVADARLFVFPPSPRLPDLVALLARAAVVLTPDTGNVHLAAAVGAPVVGLYRATGDGKPDPWRPFGTPNRDVRGPAHGTVGDIAPASVAAAFASLWHELEDARAAGASADSTAEGRAAAADA